LLLILVLASTRGRYAALLAAIIAFLSFDFFLIPPFYSFTIAHWEEWLALFVFLVTALITSQLTTVMRRSVELSRLREREARILYEVGRIMNSTDLLTEQLDSIVLSLYRVFMPWGVRACALLFPDSSGKLSIQADAPITIDRFTLSSEEMIVAAGVMAQEKVIEMGEGISTSMPVSSNHNLLLRFIPLKSNKKVLGVLCLYVERGSWFANHELMLAEPEQSTRQDTFFVTFLDQAILSIERARLRDRNSIGM
jgi:two-component system sensor histidine kinase KdpD